MTAAPWCGYTTRSPTLKPIVLLCAALGGTSSVPRSVRNDDPLPRGDGQAEGLLERGDGAQHDLIPVLWADHLQSEREALGGQTRAHRAGRRAREVEGVRVRDPPHRRR